ncbi:transcriptional regulator GcvA [Exilibacterium tricleocarpae]|uniref:Transcriptional regulator GcvA n=1 Tax=Exilibacterium tricleocarpae TaxID=2591008 RepID=A0A545SSV4_9GAMM|nr:transcriptional regulator GcvA [Exilibacterium tricleocarpae]TQV68015.1 transcriptional regulator GcvA [Exilibacterium tricleocarpae]
MRILPPLETLRVFESAASRLSFKMAAKELCVTPSAVSHQVRKLEQILKTQLFRRHNRKIELTDAGSIYLAKLRLALDEIEKATGEVATLGRGNILTLSMPPMLMLSWLMPHVSSFLEQNEEVNLRLLDTLRYVDFDQEQVDAAIWYGYGDWENLNIEFLFYEDMCPICSPQLVSKEGALSGPDDLARFRLIHTERRLSQWSTYLSAAGYECVDTQGGLRFLNSIHSFNAAINGLGVALGNRQSVLSYVQKGELVIPFELSVKLPQRPGYYFVCPPDNLKIKKVQIVRTWIKQLTNSTCYKTQ